MNYTQVSERPRFADADSNHAPGRVGDAERIASVALGAGLMVAGIASLVRGRPLRGITLAGVGGALASRGVTGRCAAYGRLGVEADDAYDSSTPMTRHMHVRHAVTINADPEKLYARWRDLASLPAILTHVKRVDVIDERRSRWVAEGPFDSDIEWEAHITDDEPGRLIAWRSEPESEVTTEGRVEFERAAGGRGTIMRVDLTYHPPGGALGAAAAKLLRADPGKEVPEDLRRFKQVMEAGESATNEGPSGRGWQSDASSPAQTPAPSRRDVPESERSAPYRRELDPVEQASRESFPASDSPAW